MLEAYALSYEELSYGSPKAISPLKAPSLRNSQFLVVLLEPGLAVLLGLAGYQRQISEGLGFGSFGVGLGKYI